MVLDGSCDRQGERGERVKNARMLQYYGVGEGRRANLVVSALREFWNRQRQRSSRVKTCDKDERRCNHPRRARATGKSLDRSDQLV